jgi:hypothetical protein
MTVIYKYTLGDRSGVVEVEIPPEASCRFKFVGTVVLDDGDYVLHVYERQPY